MELECGSKDSHVSGYWRHCPPSPRQEIWVLLPLAWSPGLRAPLAASAWPWEKWGWGWARNAVPHQRWGAPRGESSPGGWGGLSTNQEASLSPAPRGQAFLSPVPSSCGWHLTFWGSDGRPPQEVPLGEGPAPPGSLGETWPPGRGVCRGPRLCAWHWAECLCALSHLGLNSPRR